jgi:hypothetical protein
MAEHELAGLREVLKQRSGYEDPATRPGRDRRPMVDQPASRLPLKPAVDQRVAGRGMPRGHP